MKHLTISPLISPPRPFQFDFQNYIFSEDTSAFQVNGAASLKAKKEPIPFSLWWESAHYPSASLVHIVWSFVLLINFSFVFFFSRAPLDLKIFFFSPRLSVSFSMKKRPDAFFVVFFSFGGFEKKNSLLPSHFIGNQSAKAHQWNKGWRHVQERETQSQKSFLPVYLI